MRPLAIDLFCGLGGWSEGLLAEGWRVVGFDIERHVYPARVMPDSDGRKVRQSGVDFNSDSPDSRNRSFNYANECAMKEAPLTGGWVEYPAQLVLQDVLTIHGRQFKSADLIVASPPCQEYSYMAMPWSLAKQKMRDYESGVRDVKQLTALFDACFRIQREASEAKGQHIPLVVENVRGAQRWVGRARWHFGSFYLWGDVPALMPIPKGTRLKAPKAGTGNQLVAIRPDQMDESEGFRFDGVKVASEQGRRTDVGLGARFTSRDCGIEGQKDTGRNPVHELSGVKQRGSGREWFAGEGKISRVTSSKSPARKYASAMIAKIPFILSRHIAHAWKPERLSHVS